MKTLTKHNSCECKCKLDGTKFNSNQWWNNDKCWCDCKKYLIFGKDYVWNPATYNCKNGKYLASIIDDSVIMGDEVIKSYNEEINTISTNFNEKNIICKTQSFYILITITSLLIAVSMYCYLIKYRVKQKHLLPFHDTKLKQFCVGSIN